MSHRLQDAEVEGVEAVALMADGPDLRAVFVPGAGMVGASLRHRGDELLGQVQGLAGYRERGKVFGIPLLYPWANRLSGFGFEAAGEKVELDPNGALLHLDPNELPIHGVLGASALWSVDVREADDRSARLEASLDWAAHPELMAVFPFAHALHLAAELAGERLSLALTVRATGDAPVPLAFGFHPYLRLPDVAREAWQIELPVREHLLLDDRMIPTGEREAMAPLTGPLGERTFDDGYAALEGDPPRFSLQGGGRRVQLTFDEGYDWAQVYAPASDDVICFEPMTAPTDALNSHAGLGAVAPGTASTARFSLTVLDA